MTAKQDCFKTRVDNYPHFHLRNKLIKYNEHKASLSINTIHQKYLYFLSTKFIPSTI